MDPDLPLHDDQTEPPGPNAIDVDYPEGDEDDLGFSDYGESLGSSGFTSLASYVLRHSHQDGRRYQSFRIGSYPLPNDNIEQEREEMKHLMVKRLFDGHDYLAPIDENPHKILDIGTGVGLWAIDVADKFPAAQVIGVDMSPIQSPIVPHNVLWRIDDIQNTEWAPSYSGADFIHMRSIVGTLSHYEQVIESAFRSLRPGGWIEFQDSMTGIDCDDGTVPVDHPMFRFTSLLHQNFAPAHGWDPELPQRLPPILQRIGFTNVNIQRHKVPIGAWAKDQKQRELGLFMSKHVLWQFVKAVLVKWPDLGLPSKEDADSLEGDVRKAFDSPEIHAYIPWISVWAQKP